MKRPIKLPEEITSSRKPHAAVLLEEVIVETSAENTDVVLKKGIYLFSSRKRLEAFTSLCNCDREDIVALRYSQTKETNDD